MPHKNGSPALVTLLLIVSDITSFILSGLFALLVAVHLDKATFLSYEDLLTFDEKNRVIDYALWSIIWVGWFSFIRERYKRRTPFWAETLEATRTISIMALLHLALISLTHHDFSRSIWLVGWFTLIFLLPTVRTAVRLVLKHQGILTLPFFIIGEGENAQHARNALTQEWQMGFLFKGFISEKNAINISKNQITGIRDGSSTAYVVAIEDEQNATINKIVTQISLAGIPDIYVIPSYRGIPLHGAELSFFFNEEVLMLRVRNNLEPRASKIAKRAFDLAIGCLLFMPIALIISIVGFIIKLEDGGPIFFFQKRIGKKGKSFDMIKLRTMSIDAENILQSWKETNCKEWQDYVRGGFKLRNDPRLVRFGRILREYSIDELPQIFNVLKGEMSLVGPRPILAREKKAYGENFSLYKSSIPGITGLWQVSGRSDRSFSERAALDAWYIRNWSLTFDFILIMKTIFIVIRKQGAY